MAGKKIAGLTIRLALTAATLAGGVWLAGAYRRGGGEFPEPGGDVVFDGRPAVRVDLSRTAEVVPAEYAADESVADDFSIGGNEFAFDGRIVDEDLDPLVRGIVMRHREDVERIAAGNPSVVAAYAEPLIEQSAASGRQLVFMLPGDSADPPQIVLVSCRALAPGKSAVETFTGRLKNAGGDAAEFLPRTARDVVSHRTGPDRTIGITTGGVDGDAGDFFREFGCLLRERGYTCNFSGADFGAWSSDDSTFALALREIGGKLRFFAMQNRIRKGLK